ncbi:hypothetical protein KJ765_04120 [Candidatus Micrarchaeota archaeon]|nr:hypothetical protein [Candidatus Micrarchaeota archaeon]
MRINVCPECWSTKLRTPSFSDVAVPGVVEHMGVYECDECLWRGVPLNVEEKGLKDFLKKRRKKR